MEYPPIFSQVGGKSSLYLNFHLGSHLLPPKARGVRCAPSLKAVCAVCGGSEVARGVRFGPGAERRRCGGRELCGALRELCRLKGNAAGEVKSL